MCPPLFCSTLGWTMASSSPSSLPSACQDDTVQEVLQACRKGDLQSIQQIVSENPLYACQQEESTGLSPLMVAAQQGNQPLCEFLLEHGAPWNAIDRQGQCAGNYATNSEHWEVVNVLVDAGTRAELILGASIRHERQTATSNANQRPQQQGDISQRSSDTSIHGRPVEHEPCTKPDYLRQRLSYTADGKALLDSDQDAVMMEWERPMMDAHASILMEGSNHNNNSSKRVLNVGFGMGIIDSTLQKLQPELHIIVDAHPDVYQRMLDERWN